MSSVEGTIKQAAETSGHTTPKPKIAGKEAKAASKKELKMAAVKKQTQTGAGKKAANLAKKASAKNQASRQKEAKPADGREGP